MAIKIRFYLRNSDKKSTTDSTIFCRATNGRKKDIRVSTDLSIKPTYWNYKTETIKDTSLYTNEEKEAIDYTTDYLKGIGAAIAKGLHSNENYTKEDALADIQKYKESKQIKDSEKPLEILPFLEMIIKEMKSGRLLHRSKPYAPSTIKMWNSFKKVLSRFFAMNKGVTWDTINQPLFDNYVGFLKGSDYTIQTINKYIVCFNTLLNLGYRRKQHKNKDITDYFHKISEGAKTKAIYLTSKEIQALYEMPLENESLRCKVRDVFLCGCYTAQRISDYGKLSEENFTTTAKGNDVVKLVQDKTGTSVTIPILNKNLLEIADKYGYNIPHVSDVILNRYIKQICKDLSEKVPSLAMKEETILTLKEKDKEREGKIVYERDDKGNIFKERYNLVTSHTARRSAITNLYLTGKFDTYQLMSISGHKTEKAFQTYLCMSSDEIADRITETLEDQEQQQNKIF